MAGQVQKQAEERAQFSEVPRLTEGAQAQKKDLRHDLQLKIVDKINDKIELAKRHRPDIPTIDRSNFSLTLPNAEVAVVQSAGFIFTENTREKTTSIYGRDSKIEIS